MILCHDKNNRCDQRLRGRFLTLENGNVNEVLFRIDYFSDISTVGSLVFYEMTLNGRS